MARMSIDDMFLRDPRVRILAAECGWNKYETRGRLLDVFAIVYDRVDSGGDTVLTPDEVDLAADFPGLAERMVKVGLAERARHGVRIRGAKDRTKYLETREESGRRGGIKSGESRRNKAKVTSKVTFDKNEGRANPPDPVPVPDDPPVPDPPPDPQISEKIPTSLTAVGHPSISKSRRKRPKPHEPTESERSDALEVLGKLGERNGVRYTGTDQHVRLIAKHLRDGVTKLELRAVVAYCAFTLEWSSDEKMRRYLTPETLFGPNTIAKYLDPARSTYAPEIANLAADAPASPEVRR